MYTKCISLHKELCIARTMRIDLNLDKFSQRMRHYPFMISLDICDGSFSTINDPSRVC